MKECSTSIKKYGNSHRILVVKETLEDSKFPFRVNQPLKLRICKGYLEIVPAFQSSKDQEKLK